MSCSSAAADVREAGCGGNERCEPGGELRSSFGLVQVIGERGHGPAVELERAARIAPGGEQELGAPEGGGHLVLVEHDVAAGEQAEE